MYGNLERDQHMTEGIGRRGFLKRSLVAGGAALAWGSHEEKALGAEIVAPTTPAPAASTVPPLTLPKGKIKDLEISRVICGGNLIGGWAHSRDLIYVSPLIKAYHTDDKVIETFQLAERRGINTALTNPASNHIINAYRKGGGKMQWISDCAAGSLKDSIKSSVDTGADAVYVQGGICDKMVKTGQMKELESVVSFMKDLGAPFGLGAHCLETVHQCVQAGFEPDFWVKTLHKAEYWSATPESGRHTFDEVDGNKKDHDLHHDNMWCINAKETIEYMAKLNKPWIAFKTLAAGAIHPRDAFQWCFENGADFLCVGMFDFQIVENTDIAAKALQAVTQKGRPRPWIA
jgi:hypothetical protein